MTENLMTKDHKSSNKKSREGYDAIRWDKPRPKVAGKWGEGEKPDANEFFKKFIKF